MRHAHCGRCQKMDHSTEACFQQQMTISKKRRTVLNKPVKNNSHDKPGNHNQPVRNVSIVRAEPSLPIKKDAEGNIVYERQKTDGTLPIPSFISPNPRTIVKNET